MGPAVFSDPPFSLLVTRGVGFICALTLLFQLQGIDFPLELLNYLLYRIRGGVLGRHVVGLRGNLGWQVFVCVREVSHCNPVLCYRLRDVGEGFIDAHQVIVSVAALAWGLLPLYEVLSFKQYTQYVSLGKCSTILSNMFTRLSFNIVRCSNIRLPSVLRPMDVDSYVVCLAYVVRQLSLIKSVLPKLVNSCFPTHSCGLANLIL